VPTVQTLNRALVAVLALSLAFVLFSQVAGLGELRALDNQALRAFQRLWVPDLGPLFRGLAVLGGIEMTTALAAALALYLWRSGFRDEALAVLAFPAVLAIEVLYRRLVFHPGPTVAHGDGPSISQLFQRVTVNSYPSGHVLRSVLVYGLIAFVAYRLSPAAWVRRLAIPAAALMIAAMSFDRLYLAVHWESDVVGGLLLGGLALAAAVAWLDRPRAPR
jgi:membrane-associated phospholipid phosphatase